MPSSTSGKTHVDSRIFNNDSIETSSSTSGETLVRDDDSVAGGILTENPNTNISGKIYLILIIINFIIN